MPAAHKAKCKQGVRCTWHNCWKLFQSYGKAFGGQVGKGLLGNRALWSALCKIHGHRPGEGASTGAGGEGSEVQEGGEPERLGELLAVSQCHEQEKDQKGQHSWVKPGYCLEGDRGNFGLCPESRASVTELSCTLSLTLSARGPGCRRLGRKKWGMHWREDACKVAVGCGGLACLFAVDQIHQCVRQNAGGRRVIYVAMSSKGVKAWGTWL